MIKQFALLLAVSILITAINAAPVGAIEWPSLFSSSAVPGTPEWWKKNKSKAVFEPGKGYRVEGTDGYFDQEGRPMHARVSKVINQKKSDSLFEDLNVAQTVTEIKTQVGLGPDQQMAQQALAAAQDAYRRQAYSEAEKHCKQAISRWPDSKIEQDAMFLRAESQFFRDQYPEALEQYEALLKDYPNTQHLDKVIQRQFSIAHYWEKQHQKNQNWATTPNLLDETRPLFDTLGNSLKAYENIRINDPTGPLADDAIMATANSHFLRGRYNDADYYYELVRREYPRSEHQFEAHLLGLQCKLRKYQGPDYDGTPLLEAKKLIKQLKTQFAGKMKPDERNRLAETKGQLIKQLAARDFKRAKGYDDTEHYESARFYYGELVRNYPDTPLAEQAKARYMELAGKPAHPESSMAWLLDLVPESAERKAIAQVPLIKTPPSPASANPQVQIARQPQSGGLTAPGQTVVR